MSALCAKADRSSLARPEASKQPAHRDRLATPGPREDAISPERVREIFWNDIRFISAINVLGLPGAVVPVTLHKGRPIGVQLIAGRYREDLALDAASAIEKRAGTLVRQLWEQMSSCLKRSDSVMCS
jgi:Asp-tRNA(Asn)/Glu-tRNA(Gln) amidotransferase A subunit family amidase